VSDPAPHGPVLWSARATDIEGTTTVSITEEPDGIGVLITEDIGDQLITLGVVLDRTAIQQIRHVLTTQLTTTATRVNEN